jgi:predicted NBD/HSP70 family sugar kinase
MRIGVDLGGTKTELIALDDSGVTLLRRRVPTPSGDYAGTLNTIDPDVIVVGGGLSNIDRLYDGLTQRVAAHAFSDAIDTQIVRALHGDSSGVRGAARLWTPGGSEHL